MHFFPPQKSLKKGDKVGLFDKEEYKETVIKEPVVIILGTINCKLESLERKINRILDLLEKNEPK
jgi:hypothetical protein